MKVKYIKCSNPKCEQKFGVWAEKLKQFYFCCEPCSVSVNGGKSFWAIEDRRATDLKKKKALKAKVVK